MICWVFGAFAFRNQSSCYMAIHYLLLNVSYCKYLQHLIIKFDSDKLWCFQVPNSRRNNRTWRTSFLDMTHVTILDIATCRWIVVSALQWLVYTFWLWVQRVVWLFNEHIMEWLVFFVLRLFIEWLDKWCLVVTRIWIWWFLTSDVSCNKYFVKW